MLCLVIAGSDIGGRTSSEAVQRTSCAPVSRAGSHILPPKIAALSFCYTIRFHKITVEKRGAVQKRHLIQDWAGLARHNARHSALG